MVANKVEQLTLGSSVRQAETRSIKQTREISLAGEVGTGLALSADDASVVPTVITGEFSIALANQ